MATAVVTREWSKVEILDLIDRSDKMVRRSIVRIYEKQTEEERSVNGTINKNGVGFSGADAEFLSSLARQILEGRNLSVKQMEYGRKKIRKYAGQLQKIANGVI